MFEPKEIDINMRDNLKTFFLEDVISTCPHIGKGKQRKNCLLILDQVTTKILDKFMGVIDLIEGGIIGIEKLNCRRKKFGKFHAIYFVDPSDETIDRIVYDFQDQRPEELNETGDDMAQKGPLYNFCHFVFCNKISEENLERLSKVKNLVYALISIRQININIFSRDENLFEIRVPDENALMNSKAKEVQKKDIVNLANQAMSIFTVLKKIEAVQLIYQKKGVAEKLAGLIKSNLQRMTNKIYETKITKQEYAPVYLVLLNRGFDLISPLLRDESYAGMYYNLLKKKNSVLQFETEQEDGSQKVETSKLNEQDTIWLNFKYKPYLDSMKKVSQSFKDFTSKNSNNEVKNDDAGNVLDKLRSLPQFQEFMKDYSKHLNTMIKIRNEFKNSNFQKIFEYEQGIATGKKKSKQNFDFSEIIETEVKSDEDNVRLALLARYCFNYDLETISNNLLSSTDQKKKFKLLSNIMDKFREKETDYLLMKDSNQEKSLQIYQTRIASILQRLVDDKILSNKSGEISFSKHDIYPKNYKNKVFKENQFKKKGVLFADKDMEPIVVFFVIGGISINEASELNNLAESKELGDFKILLGGTSIHSPYSFLQKYIDQTEEAKQRQKDERDKLKKEKYEDEFRNQRDEELVHFDDF